LFAFFGALFEDGKHQFLFAHAVGVIDTEFKGPVEELRDVKRFEFRKMHGSYCRAHSIETMRCGDEKLM
jgi:hypothetical protein